MTVKHWALAGAGLAAAIVYFILSRPQKTDGASGKPSVRGEEHIRDIMKKSKLAISEVS